MQRAWVLALVAACGGESNAVDANLPRCDPGAPFGPPEKIEELNTPMLDGCVRLSPDEREVTFCRRNSSNTFDLWFATRTTRDEPFGAPQLVTTVNSVNNDLWPTVTPDGLTMFYDSNRASVSMSRIWRTSRASPTSAFGPPMVVGELLDGELHPFVANPYAIYFSSDVRTGLGMRDLFRADIDETGTIVNPTAVLGDVNTVEDEVVAVVSPDELRIVFRRTLGTEPDLFTATRESPTDPFGPATPITELNQPKTNEVPGWLSPDGCALYFHANPLDATGAEDIYVARRGL